MHRKCCTIQANLKNFNCECSYGCCECEYSLICVQCSRKYKAHPLKEEIARQIEARNQKRSLIKSIIVMNGTYMECDLARLSKKQLEKLGYQVRKEYNEKN